MKPYLPYIFLCFLALTNISLASNCHQSVAYQVSLKNLLADGRLDIISYNMLFLKLQEQAPKTLSRKQLQEQLRVEGLSDMISKIERDQLKDEADIIIAQEIQGKESGEAFNRRELDSQFDVEVSSGSHKLDIASGQFFRKDLRLEETIESFSNIEWVDPVTGKQGTLFKKGLAASIARPYGAPKDSPPLFISLSVHLKSMRSREGDPFGNIIRSKQAEVLDQIVSEFRERYGRNVPIIIAGDFNAKRGAQELSLLFERTGLLDVFDVAALPESQRITQIYFPRRGDAQPNQLDKILVTSVLAELLLKAGVQQYENGLPKSYKERQNQYSDHAPAYAQFDLIRLVELYQEVMLKGRWDLN